MDGWLLRPRSLARSLGALVPAGGLRRFTPSRAVTEGRQRSPFLPLKGARLWKQTLLLLRLVRLQAGPAQPFFVATGASAAPGNGLIHGVGFYATSSEAKALLKKAAYNYMLLSPNNNPVR